MIMMVMMRHDVMGAVFHVGVETKTKKKTSVHSSSLINRLSIFSNMINKGEIRRRDSEVSWQ